MSEWQYRNHQDHLQSVPVHTTHRGRREFRPRDFFIALGIAVTIVAIIAAAIWSEKPRAVSVAGALPVLPTVTPAAASPGTPVPSTKPVELSPVLKASFAGDGSWVIGKQIKRGTYRTAGGSSSCFWALRSNLSYDYGATIVTSYGRRGNQTVALGPNALAFVTYGCGEWNLVVR